MVHLVEVMPATATAISALCVSFGEVEEAIWELPETTRKRALRWRWGSVVGELADYLVLLAEDRSIDRNPEGNSVAAGLLAQWRQMVRMVTDAIRTADEMSENRSAG